MARHIEERRDASLFVMGSLEHLLPQKSVARDLAAAITRIGQAKRHTHQHPPLHGPRKRRHENLESAVALLQANFLDRIRRIGYREERHSFQTTIVHGDTNGLFQVKANSPKQRRACCWTAAR